MKLNYILPAAAQLESCAASPSGKKKHHWLATSHIETMLGASVCVRFICRRCHKLEDKILASEEYKTYQKVIEQNIME